MNERREIQIGRVDRLSGTRRWRKRRAINLIDRIHPSGGALLALISSAPALLPGRRNDVLAWNALGHALVAGHLAFTDPDDPATRPNQMRLLFVDRHTRESQRDWADEAASAVASLRYLAGQNTDGRAIAGLVGELSMNNREFTRLWAKRDVRLCSSGMKRLHHPQVGDLDLHCEVPHLPDSNGQRLLMHRAAVGSAAADALALLGCGRSRSQSTRGMDAVARPLGPCRSRGNRQTPNYERVLRRTLRKRRAIAARPSECLLVVNHVNFIWSIAESLRGPFKPSEYGSVVLPFTVLRRLDAVLADSKREVLRVAPTVADAPELLRHMKLTDAAAHQFYNTSPFDFTKLVADPQDLRANLSSYLAGFSPNVRDIFERFEFDKTLNKLAEKNKLFAVTEKFAQADFHPRTVSNIQMGLVFEELIRFANEKSNETAGDHYTPREVIKLMVELLFALDDDALSRSGVVRSIYDPTAGTGGMLSVADEYLRKMNPGIQLSLYGQDYNDASYAICKADMVIKGQDVDNIALGDTLTEDAFDDKKFDYGLSNPPFGVDWKDQRGYVDDEHTKLGFNGRFGAGTPAVSDGAMLFLLHLVSKMRKPEDGGSRMAIVLNGSPLFSGGAGGGESNIRKWLLDNDLVEAIIGLPKDMFYNTGISTYIWILTNRKDEDREGCVQLIDGREMFAKLRKGLGSKRNELSPKNLETIVGLYAGFEDGDHSKIFRNEDFLYRTITVERPLKLNWHATPDRIHAVFEAKAIQRLNETDAAALRAALDRLGTERVWKNRGEFQKVLKNAAEAEGLTLPAPLLKTVTTELGEQDDTADTCTDAKGNPEADASLRDTENVPWDEGVDAYVAREVLPYAPDAWVDHSKTKEGAEIPFTRHFYQFVPPRSLEEIDRDLDAVMDQLRAMLVQVEA